LQAQVLQTKGSRQLNSYEFNSLEVSGFGKPVRYALRDF